MAERSAVIDDFLRRAGWGDARRTPLAGDASFRRYVRLSTPSRTAMLMDAPPPKENVRPYLAVARRLRALGFSAPDILAEDAEAGLLVIEDLGDDTFTRLLAAGTESARLYALAIDALIALHRKPDAAPDWLPPYDDARLLAEAELLTEWYMPAVGAAPSAGDVRAYRDLWRGAFPVARAFIAEIARLSGEPVDEVPSPTFTLVQTYGFARATIWHFDLYRIGKAEDAWELGLEDALADGISLIEWPERLGRLLPARRTDIALAHGAMPDARIAEIATHG